MSHLRRQHVLTTILALLVISSSFLTYRIHLHRTTKSSRHTIDRYVSAPVLTTYNLLGERSAHIVADHIDHIPFKDTSVFKRPVANYYKPGAARTIISADQGTSAGDTKLTRLSGHVVIKQPATQDAPATTTKTTHATYNEKNNTAYTSAPVTIIKPDSTTTGIGFHADFNTATYKILKNTHITYQNN